MRSNLQIVLVLVLFTFGTIALADQTEIAGYTTGGFPTSTTWQHLTFTPNSFGPVLPDGSGNAYLNDIGSFDLGVCTGLFCANTYIGDDQFKLTIYITDPTNQNTIFQADMLGLVGRGLGLPFGDVNIFFDEWTKTFTYSNPSGPDAGFGQFTLTLAGNDIDLGHLHLVADRGHTDLDAIITNATFTPIPEPASIILLGTLMTGLGLVVRRRLTR